MLKYAFRQKPEKSVKMYGRNLRISTKSSVTVCRALSGLHLEKGKKLLAGLRDKKRSLNGKYYTNVVKEIGSLLRDAEAGAEYKGLDVSRLHILAAAHKGFRFYTPRRFKLRRRKTKVCNIQLVLVEK
jgi:ribosomal protein L22